METDSVIPAASDESLTQIEVNESRTRQNQLKTVAKGGGIGLIGRFSFVFLSMVFQVILARSLGAENVGLLSLGLVVVNIAAIFAIFGMDQAAIRFVARFQGENDLPGIAGTFRSSIFISFITSIVIVFFLRLTLDFWVNEVFRKPELAPILSVLIWMIPLMVFTRLFVSIAQGFKRVDHRVIIEQIGEPFLKIIGVTLVAFFIGSQVVAMSVAILISTGIACLLSIISFWKLTPLRKLSKPVVTKNVTRVLLIFSAPLAFNALLSRLNGNIELLLMGRMTSAEEVGIYALALKPSAFIILSITALSLIFAPMIAELYEKREKTQLESLNKTVTKWAIMTALPIFLILFVLSPEVMSIFGSEFVAGAGVARMLAISKLMIVLTGPSGLILAMAGFPGLILLNTVVTLIISIVVDLILIPPFGAMGAAVGATITFVVLNVMSLTELYLIMRIHPYSLKIWKSLAAGVAAFVAALLIQGVLPDSDLWRFIVVSLVLVSVYCLTLLLLGIDEEDRYIMKTIRRRLPGAGGKRLRHS